MAQPQWRVVSPQNGKNEWALLAAATLIVAAPLIVIYLSFQRFFISGALKGSLK